jgi:fido (protein-threonine AMPylation protein)
VIETDDNDPVREYTEEEQHRLTVQLHGVTMSVASGAFLARSLDLTLIQDLHQALFDGVRDHAGRIRRRGFGSERLVFGPWRSAHRDEVEAQLAVVVERVRRDLRPLLDDGR